MDHVHLKDNMSYNEAYFFNPFIQVNNAMALKHL